MNRPRLGTAGEIVDELISDLVWTLNEIPFIKTEWSCQGHTSETDPRHCEIVRLDDPGILSVYGGFIVYEIDVRHAQASEFLETAREVTASFTLLKTKEYEPDKFHSQYTVWHQADFDALESKTITTSFAGFPFEKSFPLAGPARECLQQWRSFISVFEEAAKTYSCEGSWTPTGFLAIDKAYAPKNLL